MKILIKQSSVSDSEVLIEGYGAYIEFFEKYLILKSAGKWNIKIEETGLMEERDFWNKELIEKKCDIRMQLCRHARCGNWLLDISTFRFSFETKEAAEEVFDKVLNWKLK
jgi:hypothetical protein